MKRIILSALALVIVASCSKNDETSFTQNDGQVLISSSIATRTVGDNWEAGDQIGVYMNATGGTFAALGSNVLYATTYGEGSFVSASPLYYPVSGTVDLLAYYPYSASITEAGIYAMDMSDQNDQGAIDLMITERTDVAKTPSALNMVFYHKLSNIKLEINAGDGCETQDLEDVKVSLVNVMATGDYDLRSGTIDFGTASASDITFLTASNGQSSEAIIIPQDLSDDARLSFATKDGRVYELELPVDFEAGNQYSYTVTLTGTEVYINIPTIGPWGTEDNQGEVDASPCKPDIELVGEIYQISSAAGLKAFASIVNNSTTDVSGLVTEGISNHSAIAQNISANALIINDIDLEGGESNQWTPIGNSNSNKYAGSFDGGGYEVSGLYINNSSDSQGLFGMISGATIKNLGVDGEVTGAGNIGGLVGHVNGSATITGCYNTGDVTGSSSYVGGLVGYVQDESISITTIAACYNSGNITSTSVNTGGLVGNAMNTKLTACYSYGSVSSTSNTNLGGVLGGADTGATISYCYYDTYTVNANDGNNTPAGAVGNGTSSNTEGFNSNTDSGAKATLLTNLNLGISAYNSANSASLADWVTDSGINSGYPILSWQ